MIDFSSFFPQSINWSPEQRAKRLKEFHLDILFDKEGKFFNTTFTQQQVVNTLELDLQILSKKLPKRGFSLKMSTAKVQDVINFLELFAMWARFKGESKVGLEKAVNNILETLETLREEIQLPKKIQKKISSNKVTSCIKKIQKVYANHLGVNDQIATSQIIEKALTILRSYTKRLS
ncbi:MAG: hypothetical protein L0207_04825 [Chlamydiae bacterium]|nr:hypothetical protein [Chlamydiota bacterium]